MSVETRISKKDCDLLVYGYIQPISYEISYHHHLNTPFELIEMIKTFYINYPDLIIAADTKQTLPSDKMNYFGNIILKQGSILTISQSWNGYKGGKLLIHCNNLILHKNSSIDVSGCGYRGGTEEQQGESYCGLGIKSKHCNKGGGGGGYGKASNGWICRYGAGAGYGSKGISFKTESGHNTSFEGKIYGDKELNVLYLGSGGGGSYNNNNGGNGGGVILIECENLLLMKQGSNIKANGDISNGWKYGNGSGGSIYLKCNKLKMDKNNVFVQAMSGSDSEYGLGRIRVDVNKASSHFYKHFVPKPYLTYLDDIVHSI